MLLKAVVKLWGSWVQKAKHTKLYMNISKGIQTSKVAVNVAKMIKFLQILIKYVKNVTSPLKLADDWSTDWSRRPPDLILISF